MKASKNIMNHSFLSFTTFIEYQKKIRDLKDSLPIKKSSIKEAQKILDTYINLSQKLSDDIIRMREE